jgi:hypothetical protein
MREDERTMAIQAKKQLGARQRCPAFQPQAFMLSITKVVQEPICS